MGRNAMHHLLLLGGRETVNLSGSDYDIHMFKMRCEGMIRYVIIFLCIS